MKISVEFTEEELEVIRNTESRSICERRNCYISGCCGCPDQLAFEKHISLSGIKNSKLWEYIVLFNNYKSINENLKNEEIKLDLLQKEVYDKKMELINLNIIEWNK